MYLCCLFVCYFAHHVPPSFAVFSLPLDSTCGTNGVKKSSDETTGAQSLFLNNTEHSTALAKSLVRGGLFVFNTRQSVSPLKFQPIIEE